MVNKAINIVIIIIIIIMIIMIINRNELGNPKLKSRIRLKESVIPLTIAIR